MLWQFTPVRKCTGNFTKFSSLNNTIDHLLMDNMCHSSKDPPVTMARLFLNRLTPCPIDPLCVSDLDVCRKHLVGLHLKCLNIA